MYASMFCFFSFCAEERLHDVSAHTVFVAVISQMKDFFVCSFDEDEWRRKVVYAIFSRTATSLIEKQFRCDAFFGWAK